MTSSTASSNSSGVGPFDSMFQTGAAAVSAILFLLAIALGVMGYQGMSLLSTQLNVLTGAVGLMLAAFFGLIALVVAFYMEPGFDH